MTLVDLVQLGFKNVLSKARLASLLEEKYPGFAWEKLYLLKGRFAQQLRLERAVESLFPVRASFAALNLIADPRVGSGDPPQRKESCRHSKPNHRRLPGIRHIHTFTDAWLRISGT